MKMKRIERLPYHVRSFDVEDGEAGREEMAIAIETHLCTKSKEGYCHEQTISVVGHGRSHVLVIMRHMSALQGYGQHYTMEE